MRPALGRSLPGDPISVSGLPRFTLLNRFTASMRNSRSRVEPIPKRLKIDASVRRYPGPLSELRFMLPNVPMAGREYGLLGEPIGVVSKYFSWPPLILMSPLTLGRFGPTSRSPPAPAYETSNGMPLWKVWLALNCQPPRKASVTVFQSLPHFLLLPNGSSYTRIRLNVCVRSQPVSPWFRFGS